MFLITNRRKDAYLNFFLKINALISTLAVLLIFAFLIEESHLFSSSLTSLQYFKKSWYPTEGQFNLLPMIIATVITAISATLLAIPLGFFAATFSVFYAPSKLKNILRTTIELYSAIPSVIFGFWGLMKIVPIINTIHPPGQSILAAILILTLMIFPILTLNLIASFEMASKNHNKVAQSLGLKQSTYIWLILLPSIKRQFWGGCLLSLGRAIGETMAVLMVCGNIVRVPTSIFDPVRTLTGNIALEMSYAMGEHRSALFFSGFILLLIVTTLVYLSEKLGRESC